MRVAVGLRLGEQPGLLRGPARALLRRHLLAALSPSAHAASEEAWSLPSELMTKAYDDLVAAGSMKEAKNGGTVRAEGKEYEVQDSDVLLFLFN